MEIKTVKRQGAGLLINGIYYVEPSANPNLGLYSSFLEWERSGGIVEPEFAQSELDEQAAEAAENVVVDETRTTPAIKNFINAGPSGIETYINTNVTDMASAKQVLIILAKIVWVVARNQFKG